MFREKEFHPAAPDEVEIGVLLAGFVTEAKVKFPVVVAPSVVAPPVDVMPLLKVTKPVASDMDIRTGIDDMVPPTATPDDEAMSHVPVPFLIVILPLALVEMSFVPLFHMSQKTRRLSRAENTLYTGFAASDVLY